MSLPYKQRYDVIILGTGIAGLLLSLKLAELGISVALICKENLLISNTAWAQGGIALVSGANPLDSEENHVYDTLESGAGLSNKHIVESIINNGSNLFVELEKYGVIFDRENNFLNLAKEGGHSQSRILHCKDASGAAISNSLSKQLFAHENIHIYENCFAFDLLLNKGSISGVLLLSNKSVIELRTSHIVLATGGLGQIYSRTSNPKIATGDGIAMAYRAGATLADMEFVQFHPTALALENTPALLLTEALRGAGAYLLDKNNNRFCFNFDSRGELATRDIVAKAIWSTMKNENSNNVFLDLRPIGKNNLETKFPNIVKTCKNNNLDIFSELIPVAPAAHYFMGGVLTNEAGETNIAGLYAIGETACTGLHGANRLASNSLLEAGIMALNLANLLKSKTFSRKSSQKGSKISNASFANISYKNNSEFSQDTSKFIGLSRNAQDIEYFLNQFIVENQDNDINLKNESNNMLSQEFTEQKNMQLLAHLIAQFALLREESRGAHIRDDFTDKNDTKFLFRKTIRSGILDNISISASTQTSFIQNVHLVHPH